MILLRYHIMVVEKKKISIKKKKKSMIKYLSYR